MTEEQQQENGWKDDIFRWQTLLIGLIIFAAGIGTVVLLNNSGYQGEWSDYSYVASNGTHNLFVGKCQEGINQEELTLQESLNPVVRNGCDFKVFPEGSNEPIEFDTLGGNNTTSQDSHDSHNHTHGGDE